MIGPLLELDPAKDADGLHPLNLGRLLRGEPGLGRTLPVYGARAAMALIQPAACR